ncbi:MAG: PH domain-containing protein [Parasphingorhabdus sp.]|uniref:PH domain-containing protein n=1 Tax=Parasphingorhabdus sp. TaxID=2709688 RepID=UPI003001DCE6
MTDTAPSLDPLAQMEHDKTRGYNQGLTPLHPPQKSLIRLNIGIRAVILIIAAMVIEFGIRNELPLAAGTIIGPVTAIALFLFTFLPGRIYRRWGYDIGPEGQDDQLRVLRGFMWRMDTIVPFNRIQHIDVAQGPLQRVFGLSTLIVHTAGTHNSIVALPGLSTPDAEAMRETIKGHIRQDMI